MRAGAHGSAAGDTPSERHFTTAGAPAAQQFALWRDAVAEAFVPVALARREAGAFPSTLNARALGPLQVARIASHPHRAARTDAEISRAGSEVLFFSLLLGGAATARQGGRTARLQARDFVLIDAARPFEIVYKSGFRQITLTVPATVLAPRLAAPWDSTAVRIPGDHGVGAVAAAALSALAELPGPLDRHAAGALADQVTSLAALAITCVRTPRGPASRAGLRQAVLDEIERSLGDPELSPRMVADRVGISTRYVHTLLAERGPTFGRLVLVRRLERCHRDLGDPARQHWTIAAVARRHGFRDPSHFARAFRGRYGIGPRQYRQMLAAAGADHA